MGMQGTYERTDGVYSVLSLIDASAGLPEFKLPMSGILMAGIPWDISDGLDILYHAQAIQDACLSHPIILDDLGQVADGWHRIYKAALKGKKTIKAVRLTGMPAPIRTADK